VSHYTPVPVKNRPPCDAACRRNSLTDFLFKRWEFEVSTEVQEENVIPLYSVARVLKMSLTTRSLDASVTLNMCLASRISLSSIGRVQHVKPREQTFRSSPTTEQRLY